MNEFHYTSYAQEIIFGPGAISRLGDAVERFAWQRLMLCSSNALKALTKPMQTFPLAKEQVRAHPNM